MQYGNAKGINIYAFSVTYNLSPRRCSVQLVLQVTPWDLPGDWGLASGISYLFLQGTLIRYYWDLVVQVLPSVIVYQQYNLLLQSPAGLVRGMAQGTTSLLSNTVYALSDAATQFSRAAQKVHRRVMASEKFHAHKTLTYLLLFFLFRVQLH